MVSQKGQKYLLEVCSKINDPEWKFVILGEGPLRESLEKQVIKLGLEERVLLPGAVKNIDFWLAKASVFVFPSVSENFPIALLEAMSAGIPCVSFDCDTGPSEMINDKENGFLVPVGNIDIFKSRIQELMDDETLRNKLSINAKKIASLYSIEEISKQTLEFCTS